MIGCDFAYGYPRGFASALGVTTGAGAWSAVWQLLHDLAFAPTVGGGDANNALDRFAVADELNRRFSVRHGGPGPFWGRPDWTLTNAIFAQLPPGIRAAPPFLKGQQKNGGAQRRAICAAHSIAPLKYPYLNMTSPGFPDRGAQSLASHRATDLTHGAHETWKIFANGAVGGQVLAGVPYLWKLVHDPQLNNVSVVWPFTSGFTDRRGSSLQAASYTPEIFPNAVPYQNALPRMPAAIRALVKDAWQVWILVEHARRLGASGQLGAAFAQPNAPGAMASSVTQEEGSILIRRQCEVRLWRHVTPFAHEPQGNPARSPHPARVFLLDLQYSIGPRGYRVGRRESRGCHEPLTGMTWRCLVARTPARTDAPYEDRDLDASDHAESAHSTGILTLTAPP